MRYWLLTLLGLLGACSQAPHYTLHETLPAFGGQVELVVIDTQQQRLQQAHQLVQQDLQYMSEHWYSWREGPVARVNMLLKLQSDFSGPPSVLPLVTLSKQLYQQSGGLFNPALGELFALWTLQPEHLDKTIEPDSKAIQAQLSDLPTMDDVTVNGIRLRGANPHLQLDFSGIAKGYALGQIMQHLQHLGLRNAFLRSGDDAIAMGSNNGQPWPVALPHQPGGAELGFIALQSGEAISSATAYRRYIIYKGIRYAAIIDPRSGYPARGTRQVTVIHPNPAIADAAATALFIAGPKDWQSVARAMGISDVLLIDTNGRRYLSPAMQKRLGQTSPSREGTSGQKAG